jgi:hypothetical protein
MTAAVFLTLLICLLAMRFFFPCLIVLLIGIFILADPPPVHAASVCDPAFVTMNAVLTHATMMCDKDYMDTKMGIDVMELAHECDATMDRSKIHAIMHAAIRDWESVATWERRSLRNDGEGI